MAYLLSYQSGDFTSSSTWRTCVGVLNANAYTTSIGTSFLNSATFTVASSTNVDAVAVNISSVGGTTGSFIVSLYNSTGAVEVASVTVSTSALPPDGWATFLLGDTYTLNTGTNYLIRVRCTVANEVTLFRDGTGNNWARMVRTTSSASPANGDFIAVVGTLDSSSQLTAHTVTMNNTDSNIVIGASFSSTTASFSITVGNGSALTYGTDSSTNYVLRLKGACEVRGGSQLVIGSSSSPIPSSSTARLEWDNTNTTNWLSVMANSSLIAHGDSSRGSGITFLTQTANASDTTLYVQSTSGWQSGDTLVIGSTHTNNPSPSTHERRTVSSVGSGSVVVSSGLTYQHEKTDYIAAEVCNITRNVLIGEPGGSSYYINNGFAGNTAFFDVRYASLNNLFYSSGQAVGCASGSQFIGCVFDRGLNYLFQNAGTSGRMYRAKFDGCVFLPQNHDMGNWQVSTGGLDELEVTNCVFLGQQTYFIRFQSHVPKAFTNNILVGIGMVFYDWFGRSAFNPPPSGYQISNNTFRHCRVFIGGGSFSNLKIHRDTYSAAESGLCLTPLFEYASSGAVVGVSVSNVEIIGCKYLFTLRGCGGRVRVTNVQWGGEASWAVDSYFLLTDALDSATGPSGEYRFDNVYHIYGLQWRNAASDTPYRYTYSGANVIHNCRIIVNNGELDQALAPSEWAWPTTGGNWFTKFGELSEIRLAKCPGTYDHLTVVGGFGTRVLDTSLKLAGSAFSEKLIPKIHSLTPPPAELYSEERLVPVLPNISRTISCYVRKSSSGDGQAYSGGQPKLILLCDPSAGVSSDTTLDTAAGSNGVWEKLEGSLPVPSWPVVYRVVVSCGGSSGWVNVDGWEIS